MLALAACGWAATGFETHYVDVGSSSLAGTSAIAANPADGSIYVAAYNRVIKTDAGGNTVAVFNFNLGKPAAATVDPQGNLLLVGETADLANFPATAQLVPKLAGSAAYVVKVDAGLTRIISAVLLGGSTTGSHAQFDVPALYASALAVTTDKQGNVYLTGSTCAVDFPVTPGAYQTYATPGPGLNPIRAFVTKLSPDLSTILYSTYYGGGSTGGIFSATTTGNAIVVDSRGAATIGGASNVDTLSTSGAFEPGKYPLVVRFSPDGGSVEARTDFGRSWEYGVVQGVFALALESSGNVWVGGERIAGRTNFNYFFSAGFLRKLDASFNVVLDEFIGGTSTSSAGFGSPHGLEIDPQGNIWATGVPEQNYPLYEGVPQLADTRPYIAEFSSAGSLLSLVQTPVGGLAMAEGAAGSIIVLGSPDSFLLSSSTARGGPYIVTSSADGISSGVVAPGELVSLYGSGIGPDTPLGGVVVNGGFANRVGGYQVLFNDVPAPLLYLGPNQINAVVPEEMAFLTATGVTSPTATFKVVGPSGTTNLPSVFIAPSRPRVFGATENVDRYGNAAFFAAAVNQDGTVNSPANPAVAGSVVSVWATGLGYEDAVDGSIVQQPIFNAPVSVVSSGTPLDVQYASDVPGAILGLIQVNFVAPPNGFFAIQTPSGASTSAAIWVKAP
jgi:uncharacterized protein (TIGR03437 family)